MGTLFDTLDRSKPININHNLTCENNKYGKNILVNVPVKLILIYQNHHSISFIF